MNGATSLAWYGVRSGALLTSSPAKTRGALSKLLVHVSSRICTSLRVSAERLSQRLLKSPPLYADYSSTIESGAFRDQFLFVNLTDKSGNRFGRAASIWHVLPFQGSQSSEGLCILLRQAGSRSIYSFCQEIYRSFRRCSVRNPFHSRVFISPFLSSFLRRPGRRRRDVKSGRSGLALRRLASCVPDRPLGQKQARGRHRDRHLRLHSGLPGKRCSSYLNPTPKIVFQRPFMLPLQPLDAVINPWGTWSIFLDWIED
jgi:hypothetical protein